MPRKTPKKYNPQAARAATEPRDPRVGKIAANKPPRRDGDPRLEKPGEESRGERAGNPESRGERAGNPESRGERAGNPESRGERAGNPESRGERAGNHESRNERAGNHESRGERAGNHESRNERAGNHESRGERPENLKPIQAPGQAHRRSSAPTAPRSELSATKKEAAVKATAPKPYADPHADREAQKYAQPIISREAILSFLQAQTQLLSFEQLALALKLDRAIDREALEKRVHAMLRDGQLLLNRRGGLTVAERADLIPGTIIANADGFGFLKRDDAVGEDVFLPPLQMKKVLHGDRALVSITGIDRRGKPEGLIVEILERRSPKIVGRYLEEGLFGVVAPDDRRIHQDIQIPRGASMGARPGEVVVAEITEVPTQHRPPIGRVVKIFGSDLGPQHAIDLAVQSFDLPHEFAKAVGIETSVIPAQVEPWQCKDRTDLRKLPLITIDGEDARDFDDAVYCQRTPTGGFKLVVAIADVASYVRVGSALDEEAFKRSTSVYFPGRVIPMLPEFLSNGVCSLKPDEDRLCLACELLVDADGNLKRSKFFSAVMRSHARLTYTTVWRALSAPSPQPEEAQAQHTARERIGVLMPQVQDLYALFHVLVKARERRGAIEFEGQEVRFGFDEHGAVRQVERYERNDAHRLIEECMILANVAAAKFLLKAKIPALYRAHATPPEARYEDAKQFLFELGLRLPEYEKLEPADLTKLLKQCKARPDRALIEAVVLRTQSLAVYGAENIGHFGLSLDAYAHFTSPIRRYPDLLVHRAIYHALSGAPAADYSYDEAKMSALGKTCSMRERRADEASRDVNERLKCAYLENHIGDDFTGLVTGVTSFGVFVELDDNHISGMVHVTQLPNDYYHFDAARKRLWGERSQAGLRLGDRIQIKVLRVDAAERKIDFKLLSELNPVPHKDLLATRQNSRPGKESGVKSRVSGTADKSRVSGTADKSRVSAGDKNAKPKASKEKSKPTKSKRR